MPSLGPFRMEDSPTRAPGKPLDAAAAKHTRNRYDTAAPVYDLLEWPLEKWLFESWREELWASVDGPEVLEIGVGTGKNIPYYPEGVRVTAIDLSPRMLERARRVARRHPGRNVTLLEMDAQELDLPDDTFDDVVATCVFCSVPDPVQGFREAFRVAKPGGRLLLLEHMRATPSRLASLMDKLDRPIHWLSGVHIARRTVRNVRKAGWVIDEATPLSRADVFRRIIAHKPPDSAEAHASS